MNVLQHTRNERNPFLKQNRPDRSYRDTLLTVKWLCSFGEILYEVVQLSQCLSRLVLFLDISLIDVHEVSVKVISFGN